MRHVEVVEFQRALAAQFRKPLELELPSEMRAYMTPELREMARRSPAYQEKTRVFQRLAAALDASDAWHVHADIGALLCEAAASLPPQTAFADTLIPAPFGLLVFDAVVRFPRVSIGALAWRILPLSESEDYPAGAIMTCLCHGHQPSGSSVETSTLPFGVALSALPNQSQLQRTMDVIKLVYTTFAFIDQRILDAPAAEPIRNRNAVRRLGIGPERTLPTVRVVRLRPREREESSGERRTVEWSHQWLVRGHWRQQYYRSDNTRRPLWIAPHIKGPSDKPLVVRPTVVDVS